jgi:hypothetical protein
VVRRSGGSLAWLARHPAFLFRNRERSNFTYDIDNVGELINFLAVALDASHAEVERFARELADDDELVSALTERCRLRDWSYIPRFGRRIGWYCAVRLTRPALVVETGTHDGLGTCVLARALQRNVREGSPGRLKTFDVDPKAGWLVPDWLREHVDVEIGDTRTELPTHLAGEHVGLFLHDSLHTYEHERFELSCALEHADVRLVLLSDNAHATTALRDLCKEAGADYAFFAERPRDHFYAGAGIGIGVLQSRPA